MIPKIDISTLYGPESAERAAADAAVMAAAREIGFMTAHGLPGDALSAARRKAMLAIFALPEAEKRRLYRWSFAPENANLVHGWYPLQRGHASYKEGVDMGPDVAHGPARADAGDPLTEPTPIPDEATLPGWRAAVREYYVAMEAAGAVIMRAVARGLGLAQDRFERDFARGASTLRLARYPPRDAVSFGGKEAELRIRWEGREGYYLGIPHIDSGFVTLLAQDGVAGLQAETREGAWVTVPPDEGTLAVNFGKLLERWTGGLIRATRHRVIGFGEERHSIPFFYEPAIDAVITPLGLGEDFEPFSYGDHLWETTTGFIEQRGIAHLRQPRGVGQG